MRDPDLMLSLLEEMSSSDEGTIAAVKPGDGHTGEPHRRHHHADLLVDAGHAEWMGAGRSVVRITNAGYDFLKATTNPMNGKKAWSRFIDLFNGGVPYARAAQAVVDLVAKSAQHHV